MTVASTSKPTATATSRSERATYTTSSARANHRATQAVKILKRHMKPDVLPILRQEEPTVLIDPERMAALKLALPAPALAKRSQARDGLWEIPSQK